MEVTRVPLSERIGMAQEGRTAQPEYLPSLIRQWGKTSIRAYFGGCTAELERFCELLGEDVEELLDVPFTVATPDSSTPYRQMYVAN